MKLNYSIRCTKEQKEKIQNHSKGTGLTVIDSLLLAIEQYKHNEDLNSIDNRIKELRAEVKKSMKELRKQVIYEQERTVGIKMFEDK